MSDQFDGLFMTGVQQSRGIENFFDNLFGFFARKTDLFTEENKAVTMVNQALTKHIAVFKDNVARQEAINKQKKAMQEKAAAERAAKEAAQKAA